MYGIFIYNMYRYINIPYMDGMGRVRWIWMFPFKTYQGWWCLTYQKHLRDWRIVPFVLEFQRINVKLYSPSWNHLHDLFQNLWNKSSTWMFLFRHFGYYLPLVFHQHLVYKRLLAEPRESTPYWNLTRIITNHPISLAFVVCQCWTPCDRSD